VICGKKSPIPYEGINRAGKSEYQKKFSPEGKNEWEFPNILSTSDERKSLRKREVGRKKGIALFHLRSNSQNDLSLLGAKQRGRQKEKRGGGRKNRDWEKKDGRNGQWQFSY